MKIVIDSNDLVTDEVALKMVEKVLEREDGVIKFTHGLEMTVRTTKTQRSYVISRQEV